VTSDNKTPVLEMPALHVLIVLLAGFLVYSNTFHGPIQWDGVPHIIDNPLIKDIGNFISSIRGYQSNPRRFIGFLSFALNYHFGGLDVIGYHVVNLMIHLANALLVYAIVILTFKTPFMRQSRPSSPSPGYIAFFSSLLFVSHPLQTQAVTYVIQRFTSLAAFFYLLSLIMYIKGRLTTHEPDKKINITSMAYFFFSLASAVLAMKTKEIAFTLPLVITTYEFIFFKTLFKKKLLFLLPVILTLIIVPLSVLHSDKSLGDMLADVSAKARLETDMSRWDYLMTQMRVIVTYLRLLFVPINQNLDYDYPIYHSLFTPPVFFSFVFLVSLFGLGTYLLYRSQSKGPVCPPLAHYYRLIGFGIFWFFITLSVESSIIPIADVIFEHRVYLPSVGFFVGISTALLIVAHRRRVQKIVISMLCLAILVLSSVTYARNSIWMNMINLWSDTVKKSPNKARTHFNLGQAYYDEGLMPESLKEYEAAITIKPDDAEAHNNLGVVYSKQGRNDDAFREFQTAVDLKPGYADAHNNLGTRYSEQGRMNEALREFKAAIVIRPNFAQAHYNLGSAYSGSGRNEEAVSEFQIAVDLMPNYTDALFNMGTLYLRMGRLEDAVGKFQTVLKYKPDDADTHFNLGNIYINQGRIDAAAGEFQIAVKNRPDYEEAHNNLAIAYFKQGRVDDAIREFQIALKLTPGDGEARRNLESLYRAVKAQP
jgi:tetratricopeptide (TPR) repeat protein